MPQFSSFATHLHVATPVQLSNGDNRSLRERERERERQTDRQTERDRRTDRQTDREREGEETFNTINSHCGTIILKCP